jgi:hypothetical protein
VKSSLTKWFQIMFIMVLVDFLWAMYISATALGHPVLAAIWATLMFLSGGIVTTEYVKDRMLLIPAAAGAFFGTLIGVMVR